MRRVLVSGGSVFSDKQQDGVKGQTELGGVGNALFRIQSWGGQPKEF